MRKSKLEVHLITGGGGYPGYTLGKQLIGRGHQVILLDLREPKWTLMEGMAFVKASITNPDELERAFLGVDCVYHMASYGMSGREQLNKKLIEAVNIGGTDNVIAACLKNRIKRLVYTSTYNVVFGGQETRDGDETLPYLPLDKHPDHYSRTKSVAEQAVLRTDGREGLRTCALRLAGVYGPEDQRHIPRIVGYVEQGLLVVSAAPESVQDFLHVENLAQGHLLAGEGLTEDRGYVAAGQAYFLSDSCPVNTLEFYRPLIEGLGYSMPKIVIPVTLLYYFAFITEWVHFIVARIHNFQPMLTRTEVYKSCVTHYYSVNKARKDLRYNPEKKNDIKEVLEFYKKEGRMKKVRKQSMFMYYIVNIIIALVFASVVMSFLPGVK
ncbi:short-chain dehydrogenase/reductase family 42E member 1-like isoform X1 [Mizuhopecten yessoensis]|uniref:Short-chain dehydrogenase/reductase family 42E member 1 n=1 Tax=Mizuhopecten yessoensis TaxID=6573 RepID=A0A210QTM1_MIZYE|nr:short-chain dehydrogenase/reductase family 42E member 1-like isoform X1 [Mizuhopecten yessoensis]OWF52098.1 Short-chain dehydrogenase/reductase family 42E member 1 [Mizuhopecten yessoensis]